MTSKIPTSACSGLSALIQAATSQLGLLAETANAESDGSTLTSPTLEPGYASAASSDLDLRDATSPRLGPSRTPVIVPEQDPDGGKLSFPEQLMTLLMDPANEDVVTFLPDGKYFAIRRKEFSDNLLYENFHITNWEEFLELMRGWSFARINCNDSNDDDNDHSNESSTNASSNSSVKAAIHVFRHPHFKKNHPVDMHKIRFGSKKHTARVMSLAPGASKTAGEATTSNGGDDHQVPGQHGAIEKTISEDYSVSSMSSKRRLSPSHVGRDSEDVTAKGLRVGADAYGILPAVSASHDACDPPPQLRRSSIELRGVAQAIATSKLNLPNGEVPEEDENQDNGSGSMHNTIRRNSRKAERRSSTASLVDGAVEAATHTIVTDAIESLLFDEEHTRETYRKHEKELSISTLPGVIPISKQLFASDPARVSNGSNAAISEAKSLQQATSDPNRDSVHV